MANVVILGGGIGGTTVAKELAKKLGSDHQVTLIDRAPKHVFQPSFPLIMLGQRKPSQISRRLNLLGKKIKFINAEVREINIENKTVKTSSEDFKYDFLVVALGAELAPQNVQGFSQNAQTFYSLEGAIKLREDLGHFNEGNLVILIPSMPYKCPAAPYEGALLLDYYFRKKGLRDKVNISVYTVEPQPMPVAGSAVGDQVKELLETREIPYQPNIKIKSISNNELVFEDDSRVSFDFLVGVPPHKGPQVVKDAGLSAESGWIPVDAKTLATNQENVYAIGDVTTVKLAAEGMMLSKAGTFAHAEGKVVANNIFAQISGMEKKDEFNGYGSCFLETGFGKAGYGSGDFYAEPKPKVTLKGPSRIWHFGKIIYEKSWLARL